MNGEVKRIGRFTSSNIWKLTTLNAKKDGFGAPALTYIQERKAERFLGRSVDVGAHSQAIIWGKIMEHFCNEFELSLEYSLCSKETKEHPKYKFWSGSQDAIKTKTACEIKCYYPKAFFEFTQSLLTEDLETIKKNHKEEYWQVVSNAIILGFKKAELIAYTPSESQLIEIRKQIEETNVLERLGIEPWEARFIVERPLHELPYIPDGIVYPNFVTCEFDIPKSDIDFLTECVINAETLLTA